MNVVHLSHGNVMGGRRATSLVEVLGPSQTYPQLERDLHRGIAKEDARAISAAAASLAKKSLSPRRLDSYLELLLPFIKKRFQQQPKGRDLRADVRREWSRIKRAHEIRLNHVVNDAVVQAVIDLLRAKSS